MSLFALRFEVVVVLGGGLVPPCCNTFFLLNEMTRSSPALFEKKKSMLDNHQAPLMFQAGVGCRNTDHNTVVEVLMICNYIRPDYFNTLYS